MDLLELNVLGAFRINSGGQMLADAATDKARALLTFLALEGAQPRTSLTALLWPYLPQDTAFDNLRTTLYRWRQRVDERIPGAADLLITSRQSVQLDPQRVSVDVLRFQTLLAECARHLHGALAACDGCLERLADAVELYQGELLAGFGLGDAPAFEEWLLLHREMLQQQVLLALAELTTAWEARGDFACAHAFSSRSLALDPLREETQRQQMRLLVRLGRPHHALQQYESCRRLLREELGVEPDPATVVLYEQIRRGAFLPPTAAPPAAPQAAPQADLLTQPAIPVQAPSPEAIHVAKWGEVPETGRIYGREAELAQLKSWLSTERCQLVVILGIGGMGKTTLAAASATASATDFDKVIWRSLLNAPPLDELLRGVLQSIAHQPSAGWPTSLDEQLNLLLKELRQQRSLLVLDNLESILEAEGIGQMRAGYEGYAQLIRCLVENRHNSVLLLTSRERPQGMARWEGDLPWVRSFALEGLDVTAGQAILTARGLASQGNNGHALVERYSGHPLALKLVAETIQELFIGDIGVFLASDVVIFDDIRAVLDQQFARLPALEQEILFWFAIEREPISLETLHANLVPTRPMQEVVQALRSLQRRSLAQRASRNHAVDPLPQPLTNSATNSGTNSAESWTSARFASPNVIMEYLVDLLVKRAPQEIEDEQLRWLHKVAFMQAQAQEYIRQIQTRLLLQPLASRLEATLGRNGIGVKILRLFHTLRTESPTSGYAAGNLLNLLNFLEIDVGPLDLAGLSIWQADLLGANLPGSNLAGADLRDSRFADAFNGIRAVAISPDGTLVAGGTQGGEVRLWNVANGQLVQVYRGHKGAVRSIAFHPDGTVVASGSEDQTVHLWEVEKAHTASKVASFARLLAGHDGRVTSVVFLPGGKTLASGSIDGTVRLWEVASGEMKTLLRGQEYWVSSIAVSPDGCTLASGSYDGVIRLWDLQTTELRATIAGHKDLVSSLDFDQTGDRLASGSYDCHVCVWDLSSGQKIYEPESAPDVVTGVAFSPDGELLATSCDDYLIRVWEVRTGRLASVFDGHTDNVSGVAFSADGQMLVSGGNDQRLCLWDVPSGRIYRLFSGYSRAVNSVAFHPNGKMLASAHDDQVVRLWDLDHQELRQVLYGHTLKVNSVAFDPPGTLLASGSDDKSIHVWMFSAAGDARRHSILRGHQRDVVAINFHPDGRSLVSASKDQTIGIWGLHDGRLQRFLPMNDMPVQTVQVDPTGRLLASDSQRYIRLWDAQSGLHYATLKGHANYIWSLDFSPDGRWLASGGLDGAVALWDVRDPAQAQLKATLHGHSDRVFIVAFHPNGRFLASGSADQTVRLWDLQSYEVVHTFKGHTHWIWSLAFSPDGNTIVSGGWDETIRLWDSRSGAALGVLHAPGPYAGMNISGVKGISDAERTTLKLLGAVER